MSNSFLVLHITSVPPGDAPEWVRQKWVGLSLALAQQSASAQDFSTMGVLSNPRGMFSRLFASLTGSLRTETGYLVESRIAIEILDTYHPEAASWWREFTPHFLQVGQCFLFQEEVGNVVEQIAP